MLGLTPLEMNGGANELLHGPPETSPGKKKSGKKERKIKISAARFMACSPIVACLRNMCLISVPR